MNTGLKQRLVGAVVLIAIAVIFIPTFLRDRQVEPVNTQTLIPEAPEREEVEFEAPQSPEDIEPAPEPETMFMPDDGGRQPAVDSLEQARDPEDAEQSADADGPSEEEQGGEPGDDSPDGNPEPAAAGDLSVGEEATAEQGGWVLQVASLRSEEGARQLRTRLREQGYRAYVRTAQVDDQQVSRVYIGPKIGREAVEALKSEVDEALSVDSLVLRFEP